MTILGPGLLEQTEDTASGSSFYLISPGIPSFFYWESHSNSSVELTSEPLFSSHAWILLYPALVKDRSSWYLYQIFICCVTEVWRDSERQFCTCLFLNLWERQISVEWFLVGILLTAKELHITLMSHASRYHVETTGAVSEQKLLNVPWYEKK